MIEPIKINPDTRELEINESSYFLLLPEVAECIRPKYNKSKGDYKGLNSSKAKSLFVYATLMLSPKSPYAMEEGEKRDVSARKAFGSIEDWDFRSEEVFSDAYDAIEYIWRLDGAYKAWDTARRMYEITMYRLETSVDSLTPDTVMSYMDILDQLPDKLNRLEQKALESRGVSKSLSNGRKIGTRENPEYIRKFTNEIPRLEINGDTSSTKKAKAIKE